MQDFHKARRGDLAALRVEFSVTPLRGKTVRRASYLLGEVTSVSCDGRVKAIRDLHGVEAKAVGHFADLVILPAGKLDGSVRQFLDHAAALLGDRYGGAEIRDQDELRAIARPFLKVGKVVRWPNGLGWDVDGHEVVRAPDGRLAARFIDLPEGVEPPSGWVDWLGPGRTEVPTDPALRAFVRTRLLAHPQTS